METAGRIAQLRHVVTKGSGAPTRRGDKISEDHIHNTRRFQLSEVLHGRGYKAHAFSDKGDIDLCCCRTLALASNGNISCFTAVAQPCSTFMVAIDLSVVQYYSRSGVSTDWNCHMTRGMLSWSNLETRC